MEIACQRLRDPAGGWKHVGAGGWSARRLGFAGRAPGFFQFGSRHGCPLFVDGISVDQGHFAGSILVFIIIPNQQLHASPCIALIPVLVVGAIRKIAGAPDVSDMRRFSVSVHAACISRVGIACAPVTVCGRVIKCKKDRCTFGIGIRRPAGHGQTHLAAVRVGAQRLQGILRNCLRPAAVIHTGQ